MQLLAERRVPTTTETEGAVAARAMQVAAVRFTILVLKSNQEIEVMKYKRDGDLLVFQDTQARKGSVAVGDVDWRRTSEMTGEVRSVDTRPAAFN
jgi:hypothetical protein